MGYETTNYYMYGVKVPEYFDEFKDLYFTEVMDMFKSIDPEELGDEEKQFVQKMKNFWTPLTDWYDFERATDIAVQHAGDLRFSVDFVFMGEDISGMDDDQSKNQFAEAVKKKLCSVLGLHSDYGGNHITDGDGFAWCSFSWTC